MEVTIERTATETLIQDEFSRKADFRVGVVATKKVVPNLNISFDCASGEEKYFINLNRRGVTVGSEKETYVANKLSLKVGDETDIWHVDADGKFKWDIEYAVDPRPVRGVDHIERWDLVGSSDLRFFYQDTLENDWAKNHMGITLEEYLVKCRRPENVVGSYAVYCGKRNSIKRKDGSTRVNYATGKLAHIYRPLCIDAIGKKVWGVLNITGGVLSVTIPALFLDTAVFPVTLDPTIGSTATAASNVTTFIMGSRFISDVAGDANPGTFYCHGQRNGAPNKDGVGGVYADNSGTVEGQDKLSTSDPVLTFTNSAGWKNGSVTWTGIEASTDYWLAWSMDNVYLSYDTSTPGYNDAEYKTYAYTGTAPDPFPSGISSIAWEITTYIEYTEAESGYTLPCGAGNYTTTGQDADPLMGRNLGIGIGAYALTGQIANPLYGRAVDANSGSYGLTGQDANTLYDRLISAGVGSIILTGSDVSLLRGFEVAADSGTYALTGQTASLLRGLKILVGSGSYTLAGQDVILIWSGGGISYTLVCDVGNYALTGQIASTLYNRAIDIGAGSIAITGTDASLLRGFKLPSDSGSYILTGGDATLLLKRVLAADVGNYTLVGYAATLTYSGETAEPEVTYIPIFRPRRR